MGEIKCPHCGSTQVRPSHKHAGDTVRMIYRCRACKRHFKIASPRSRLKIFAGAALLVLLLIGLTAGLFLGKSSDPSPQPSIDISDDKMLASAQAAAKHGDPQAQYDLAWIYWKHADYPQALPWIKAAASRNNAEAENLLGMAYLKGYGTVQNFRAALEQFTKAAGHGHLEAQYQLGIFYRDGIGTPSNKELAYLWLNIAAARGHQEAPVLRDKLAMIMSVEELTRAQEASAQALTQLSGAEKNPM